MEFGIDLGTTQSCIAYIDDTGKPVVVKSALGEDTTPSVVFFESPAHAVVGRAASDEALITPDLVAQLVKRDIGTGAGYTFHGDRHTPETVSALILRELARVAAAQSGQPVRDVLITVPANFGIAEREATRRAGELAGLNVLDLLDEPVAAAVHYTAVNGPAVTPKHALMCDLGGGTFDTTVIRLAGDDVTVVCVEGDPRLGGADWDRAIAGHLLGQFEREHPGLHPDRDPQLRQDLLLAAERLKKELSSARSRRHVIRFGGRTTVVELARSTVEELTAGLLARMTAVIDKTMETARAKGVTSFDEVLLVGGMSRFPAVTDALRERFGVRPLRHEPELAVAKGAALYARVLGARSAGRPARAGASGRVGIGLRRGRGFRARGRPAGGGPGGRSGAACLRRARGRRQRPPGPHRPGSRQEDGGAPAARQHRTAGRHRAVHVRDRGREPADGRD